MEDWYGRDGVGDGETRPVVIMHMGIRISAERDCMRGVGVDAALMGRSRVYASKHMVIKYVNRSERRGDEFIMNGWLSKRRSIGPQPRVP